MIAPSPKMQATTRSDPCSLSACAAPVAMGLGLLGIFYGAILACGQQGVRGCRTDLPGSAQNHIHTVLLYPFGRKAVMAF